MDYIGIITGSTIGATIGGGLVALFSKLIDKLIDERFARRTIVYADRRQLRTKILKVCAEAKRVNYSKQPENIKYLTDLVEVVNHEDKIIGYFLQELISKWKKAVELLEQSKELRDDRDEIIEFAYECRDFAKSDYEELIKRLNKWK